MSYALNQLKGLLSSQTLTTATTLGTVLAMTPNLVTVSTPNGITEVDSNGFLAVGDRVVVSGTEASKLSDLGSIVEV